MLPFSSLIIGNDVPVCIRPDQGIFNLFLEFPCVKSCKKTGKIRSAQPEIS